MQHISADAIGNFTKTLHRKNRFHDQLKPVSWFFFFFLANLYLTVSTTTQSTDSTQNNCFVLWKVWQRKCVCVCVRAYVRARVRVYVCVRARARARCMIYTEEGILHGIQSLSRFLSCYPFDRLKWRRAFVRAMS